MSNTAIWDAVCETDPKFTKGFKKGGGFSGTSTNSTYLHLKATRLWGPCGKGWGYEVIDEKYVDGAEHEDGRDVIHVVRVRLWYVSEGERCHVEQYGQTSFVFKNKYGWQTDEEAPKKSLTDGVSKCLAALGFSADIFQGLYDDNKYVAAMEKKYAEPPPPPDPVKALNVLLKRAGCSVKEEGDTVVSWLTSGGVTTVKQARDDKWIGAVMAAVEKQAEPVEGWLDKAREWAEVPV